MTRFLSIEYPGAYYHVTSRGNLSLSKKITLYLFHKYSDKRLREIGGFFGIGESAVSDASRRFGVILKKDRKLRKKIELLRD